VACHLSAPLTDADAVLTSEQQQRAGGTSSIKGDELIESVLGSPFRSRIATKGANITQQTLFRALFSPTFTAHTVLVALHELLQFTAEDNGCPCSSAVTQNVLIKYRIMIDLCSLFLYVFILLTHYLNWEVIHNSVDCRFCMVNEVINTEYSFIN
jgi:hypothetical protein